jgi:cellulose synthase/poly-beta-1,6-N-acetylglucosamine synthase-like glycosyltransferase
VSHPLHPPWDILVLTIEVVLFSYFLMVNGYYLVTGTIALLSLPGFVKLHLADPIRRSNSMLDQPVSIVVPAFNEESILVQSLRSLLALDYVNFEIIVVNDGSTDETLEKLEEAFKLEPYEGVYRSEIPTQDVRAIYQSAEYTELRIIDKANGGKGDALNAGINLARFPLIFSADADSYYQRQTLQWMIEPFQKDPRTVVTGGAIGVDDTTIPKVQGAPFSPRLPKKMIQRFQVLEYLRAFLATRMGFAPFNALGIVSGACGMWKREILVACGGFRTDTIWEDLEMTLRVHNYCISTGRPYRVSFTPYPVCWTDVPDSLRVLYNQRKGWHRHVSECMMIHRKMLFGSGGMFSWIAMPYFFFFEWLAPLMIVVGVSFSVIGALVGFLDWTTQWWLLGLVFILAIMGSVISILLDEISFTAYRLSDVWSLFIAAFLENFGYRQFVTAANFAGLMAWLFRQPIRGSTKYPGFLVPAWTPKQAKSKRTVVTNGVAQKPAWTEQIDVSATALAPEARLALIARLGLVGAPWCEKILRQAELEENDPSFQHEIGLALADCKKALLA